MFFIDANGPDHFISSGGNLLSADEVTSYYADYITEQVKFYQKLLFLENKKHFDNCFFYGFFIRKFINSFGFLFL